MTSERTCHFTGDDAWKCGTHCTCQHFNWNNKGQTAMTSELRPAVEVWWKATDAWKEGLSPEDGTEAATAVIEADREAVRAEIRQALIATGEAAARHLKEAAKLKALAETLAWALGEAVTWNSHDDEGVAAVWLDQADEALRQYKEATQ